MEVSWSLSIQPSMVSAITVSQIIKCILVTLRMTRNKPTTIDNPYNGQLDCSLAGRLSERYSVIRNKFCLRRLKLDS